MQDWQIILLLIGTGPLLSAALLIYLLCIKK